MAAHENISFGQFGDRRDDRTDEEKFPSMARRLYQPEGSKAKYELGWHGGIVTAHKLGKPDEILPGGRPAKQLSGELSTWDSRQTGGNKEVLTVAVRGGSRGKGLADAMLNMAVSRYPDLSHSDQLSAEGARFAARNPLPGDKPSTREAVKKHITADAVTTMLGGPKRRGYV